LNKAKTLRSAEKHVMQGRLHSAISEYKKIVEEDRNDLPILNTIGDLYVRLGNTSEGLKYFNQLATAYVEGGFKVKAIAIYKKITKLDPEAIEPRRHLAELYAMQGLMSDARAQYLQLAESYLADSRSDLAAEALHKLLSGDPNNATILARLVGIEIHRGNKDEGLRLLLGAAERLRKRGELAEAKELLAKAQEIDAEASSVRIVLARVLFAEGQHDEAIAKLRQMDPGRSSTEIQLSLWECLYEANQLEEAGQVALHLFGKDSTQYPLLFSLSDRYLAAQNFERLIATLDPLIESPMIDTFGGRISEILQKILSEEPDHLPAIERAVKVNRKLGQSHLLSLSLEHLASYHLKQENFTAALTAYEELLGIDPTNSIVRQGIARLQRQMEYRQGTGSPPPVEEAEETEREEFMAPPLEALEEPVAKQEEEKKEEEPTAREFELTEQAQPIAGEKAEEEFVESFKEEEVSEVSGPVPQTTSVPSQVSPETNELVNGLILEGELLMGYGLLKRAAQLFEELLRISPDHTVALRQLVEIYSSLGQLGNAAICCTKLSEVAIRAGQPKEAHLWAEKGAEFSNALRAKPMEAEAGPPAPPMGTVTPPVGEVAAEAATGSVYDLSGELEEISQPAPVQREPEVEPVAEVAEPALKKEQEELQEAIEEIDFYIEQGFWAEARALIEKKIQSFPESAELRDRLDRCESAPKEAGEEGEGMEEISEKLHEAGTTPPAPTAISPETQVELGIGPQAPLGGKPPFESHPPAPGPAETSPTQGLGDLFAEFNIVESPVDASADFNTHYNLGIAFREMGLLEEAIAEVQKAISILNPREQKQDYLSVCSLLGLCLVESKNYPEAIEWMVRGLMALGDADKNEEYLSLEYDLANAYQLAGNSDRATEIFQKIENENPKFRDVEKRLQSLHRAKLSN